MMPLAVRVLAVAALLNFLASLPAVAQTYRLTHIISPAESDPRCRSDHARLLLSSARPGRLVGGIVAATVNCYETSAQDPNEVEFVTARAFAWNSASGGYYLSQLTSVAADIAPGGIIVGGARLVDGGSFEAVRWVNGVTEALSNRGGTPCGHYSQASAANRQGDIAGFIGSRNPASGTCEYQVAFRHSSGTVQTGPLGTRAYAVNDSGVVAGVRSNGVFLWNTTNNTWTHFTGHSRDIATDIDNSNAIVGYAATTTVVGCTLTHEAVHYTSTGTRHVLAPGFAGAQINKAYSINERGQIVGTSGADYSCATPEFPQDNGRAILWSPPADEGGAHVPVDLNSRIDALAGVVLTEALDINEIGSILASGYFTGDPWLPCPLYESRVSPSGVVTYEFNPDRLCRQQHLFRLMPTSN